MKSQADSCKINDGVELLNRRYICEDTEMNTLVEEEFRKLETAQLVYDLRRKLDLTQAELADLVGTTYSVIALLEDAEYDGQTKELLERIATL